MKALHVHSLPQPLWGYSFCSCELTYAKT